MFFLFYVKKKYNENRKCKTHRNMDEMIKEKRKMEYKVEMADTEEESGRVGCSQEHRLETRRRSGKSRYAKPRG